MDFRFQGLNILYIMPAVLAIIYINAIGQAAKKKLSYLKAPSLLVGFITNLALMAPLLVFVNLNKTTNYQVIFIIYTIILFIGSIIYVKDANKLFKPSKMLIAAIISTYTLSLLSEGILNKTTLLGRDYWLYGRWFTEASNFMSLQPDGTEYSITYAFTTMYRWMGSFSGMLSGPTEIVNNRSDQMQVFTTLIWISMSIQFVRWYIKDLNNIALIAGTAIAALVARMYGTGFYGSFSIFFISLLAIRPAFGYKSNKKELIYLSCGYIFLASSIIFMAPMIVIAYWVCNDRVKRLPEKLIKISPLVVAGVGYVVLAVNNTGGGHWFSMDMAFRPLLAGAIVYLGTRKLRDNIMKIAITVLAINLVMNTTWNLLIWEGFPKNVVHRFANFIFIGDEWSVAIQIVTLPIILHMILSKTDKIK